MQFTTDNKQTGNLMFPHTAAIHSAVYNYNMSIILQTCCQDTLHINNNNSCSTTKYSSEMRCVLKRR